LVVRKVKETSMEHVPKGMKIIVTPKKTGRFEDAYMIKGGKWHPTTLRVIKDKDGVPREWKIVGSVGNIRHDITVTSTGIKHEASPHRGDLEVLSSGAEFLDHVNNILPAVAKELKIPDHVLEKVRRHTALTLTNWELAQMRGRPDVKRVIQHLKSGTVEAAFAGKEGIIHSLGENSFAAKVEKGNVRFLVEPLDPENAKKIVDQIMKEHFQKS